MTLGVFTWIVAVITLSGTVFFLRSIRMLLIQLLILVSLSIAFTDLVYVLVSIIQFLFTLYMIYRFKLAIDYNYALVKEKTHLIERTFTKNGESGARKSF